MLKKLILLLACISLVILTAGCSDDDESEPSEDMMADQASDSVDDGQEDAVDVEIDVDPGAGTIAGNVFWNLGEVQPGTLTVGLWESNPPMGEAVFSDVRDPAELPTTFEFTDVRANTGYWLVAFYDVGGDDSIDSPGPEDYLAVTEDQVSVGDGETTMANVELQ